MSEEETSGGDDRRGDYRHEHNAPVRFRVGVKQPNGAFRISAWTKGVGGDFSGNGVSFYMGKALQEGTLVLLSLPFPTAGDPIYATAEVLRHEKALFRGKPAYKIMLRFVLIDERDRNRLISFVISHGKAV